MTSSLTQNGNQDFLKQQQQIPPTELEQSNLEHEQLLSLPNLVHDDVTSELYTMPSNLLQTGKGNSPIAAHQQPGQLLLNALEHDSKETALQLIEDCNFSISNLRNDEDSNCLMIAARKNNLEVAEKLLHMRRLEIDVNDTDIFGWTALMYASYYGHAEMIKLLLLAGAQVDICDNDHMSCLIWAAGRGNLDCVTKLLQLGQAKVNQVDKYGTSPLIWACRKGYLEVANVLLKAGANIDTIGMFGWSAVLVAVHGDHIETLKLLLQHKPNINTCDNHRCTPLIVASKEGKLEMVRLILKARALVNLTDKHGYTALIYSTKGAHLEVVDLLLKNNADVNHVPIDKRSALFWAVEKGNLKVVERLLQAKPDLDMVLKDGETCLVRAEKLRKTAIADAIKAKTIHRT